MSKIEKVTLPNVKNIIAVASGKGGVGKSTVAANLALAFAQNGYKTALVDADLFGPSVPTMFGTEGESVYTQNVDEKDYFIPIERFGVKLMSIGFLVKPEQALIWRGPMASSVLLQLFSETLWQEIDFMVVDLPPGTGDIPLTLCQQIDVDGVVVVTTPQIMSLADVRKAIDLFRNPSLDKPILGIVENMAWFSPLEHPNEKYFLFGTGGGEVLSQEYNLDLLSQIPLVDGLAQAADKGSFYNYNQSKMIQEIYRELSSTITEKLSNKQIKTTTMNINKIAVPIANGDLLDQHFGNCSSYKIFNISGDNKIESTENIKSANGCGCKSDIATVLAKKGVTLVLAGGIGSGAINVLKAEGIDVVRGCEGDATEVVNAFLAGLVKDSGITCRAHEGQNTDGHEHVCSH